MQARGRQRTLWMDNIKNWLLNVSLREVVDPTRDREAFGLQCHELSLTTDATQPDLMQAQCHVWKRNDKKEVKIRLLLQRRTFFGNFLS